MSEREAVPGPTPPDILPGRSGVTTDANGDIWANYGDDDLPEHGRHVDRNQTKHLENRGTFGLAKDIPGVTDASTQIRKEALQGVAPAGKHPVAGWPRGKTRSHLQCLTALTIKIRLLSSIVRGLSQVVSSGIKWTTKEPPTENHPNGQDITYKRPEGFKSKFISTIDSGEPDIGEQRKLYSWENLAKQSGTVKLRKSLPRVALDSTRVGYRSLLQKRWPEPTPWTAVSASATMTFTATPHRNQSS